MDKETYEQYQMQDVLQQRQLDSNQNMYAPQMQEQVQQNQAVLVEQTNPNKVVRDIINRLSGLEERADGTIVKIAEPKLNKLGVENIKFILSSHINQGVILSHLEKRDINNLMDSIQEDLVDDLQLNWKIYGIVRKTDLDAINNSVLYNIYVALKRAEGQNEKNWLGKISVESISSGGRMSMPKKEGFWSKLRL